MTLDNAIIQTLEDNKNALSTEEILKYIREKEYFDFKNQQTPLNSVDARAGKLFNKGDQRIKRTKIENKKYYYYFSQYETEIDFDKILLKQKKQKNVLYTEKSLHVLLSTYLKNKKIITKTIPHEQSINDDDKQTWVHPDMIGVEFNNFSVTTLSLFNNIDRERLFKLYSFELKREITNDHELKNYYFQAVSNSSWANYGYLVSHYIDNRLYEELGRLNDSFGIGIIELHSNPFKSEILFPSKYHELDIKTIDKMCRINPVFNEYIIFLEKYLTRDVSISIKTQKDIIDISDSYYTKEIDIIKYCIDNKIEIQEDDFDND